MIDIKINITNKIANAIGTPFIVCGNSDYTVTFTFDAEWGAYQEKTARFFFVADGIEQYIDVLFSGNTCNAPVLPNIEKVLIGVYTGNLRTTTGAEVRCKRSILFGGKVHEPPTTEDVYNEILEIVSKKLGSEGGTVTGDYYKDGNTFIHEGNLDLLDNRFDNRSNITATATGSAITIESSQAPLQNLKLYGKTTQDGTPTPDNPIELKSVGDSGSFEVGVYGSNILRYPYKDTTKTLGGITFIDNGDGTITANGTATENTYFEFQLFHGANRVVLQKGEKYAFSGCASGGSSNTYYLVIQDSSYKQTYHEKGSGVFFTAEHENYTAWLNIKAGTTLNNVVFKPQLELGTEVTPFKPYTKQSITFTDTSRGIGNFKDEKDFIRGIKTEKIYEMILTGTEAFILSENAPGFFLDLTKCFAAQTEVVQTISTHFEGVDSTWIGQPNNTVQVYGQLLKIRYDDCVTLDDFKSFLAEQYANGNPVKVQYVRQAFVETPLTETELNAYRHLMTNKGTTTILSEADMEVDYYINKPNAQAIGNIHTQVNKDYLKLQQAIISTGGN